MAETVKNLIALTFRISIAITVFEFFRSQTSFYHFGIETVCFFVFLIFFHGEVLKATGSILSTKRGSFGTPYKSGIRIIRRKIRIEKFELGEVKSLKNKEAHCLSFAPLFSCSIWYEFPLASNIESNLSDYLSAFLPARFCTKILRKQFLLKTL